jgi:gluconokinase
MVILLMGTTGAGKTTLGQLLFQQLGWSFVDADDLHPPANIEKMKQGIALTDADRLPWLGKIHEVLVELNDAGENVILACSALKQSYREQLSCGLAMQVVYLRGSYEQMRRHIIGRHGHFAGEAILAGQFADLEEPHDALVLEVSGTPQAIAGEAMRRLNLSPLGS